MYKSGSDFASKGGCVLDGTQNNDAIFCNPMEFLLVWGVTMHFYTSMSLIVLCQIRLDGV